MTRTRARHLRWVGALALAGSVLAGCVAAGADRREAVAIMGVLGTGDGVGVNVGACNANAEITMLEEDVDEVRVEVTGDRQRGESPGCADLVKLSLSEPLADRLVVDLTTGREFLLIGTGLPVVAGTAENSGVLDLTVLSCHAVPRAAIVAEDDVEVRVRVTAVSQRPPGAEEPCEQQARVTPTTPLGDRRLVDDTTGEPILVS